MPVPCLALSGLGCVCLSRGWWSVHTDPSTLTECSFNSAARAQRWRMARRSAALSQRRRPVSCTAPLVTIISDGLDIEAPKSRF